MNRDEITRKTSELSTIAHTTEDSKVEYWYARELMTYMGYDRWENFSKAITRAKQACDNSGVSVESHFRDTTRDVTLGSGATRSILPCRSPSSAEERIEARGLRRPCATAAAISPAVARRSRS